MRFRNRFLAQWVALISPFPSHCDAQRLGRSDQAAIGIDTIKGINRIDNIDVTNVTTLQGDHTPEFSLFDQFDCLDAEARAENPVKR